MIGVNDEIADRQARCLCQHVGSAAHALPLTHQPVAENILLANDDKIRSLEAFFKTEHGAGRLSRAQRLHVRERLDLGHLC